MRSCYGCILFDAVTFQATCSQVSGKASELNEDGATKRTVAHVLHEKVGQYLRDCPATILLHSSGVGTGVSLKAGATAVSTWVGLVAKYACQ